jgi:hypothetical protein
MKTPTHGYLGLEGSNQASAPELKKKWKVYAKYYYQKVTRRSRKN